jgi:hypothetical protein
LPLPLPLPFVLLIVARYRALDEGEFQEPKRERVFKIMTPKKSFYARTKTEELREAWFTDLCTHAQ